MTLSMATNVLADPVDLSKIRHDLIHDVQSQLQTSEMLQLQQTLTSGEPDHGKWMRISPEDFAATGLLSDLSGAEYLLVKWNGPNLGIVVVGAVGTGGSGHPWGSEHYDGDDPSEYVGDEHQPGGQGNPSSSGPANLSVSVPDAGVTAILLGLSFLGLDALRRKPNNR